MISLFWSSGASQGGTLFQSVMRRSWLRVERMLRVARVAEEEVLVRRMVRVAVSGMPKAEP